MTTLFPVLVTTSWVLGANGVDNLFFRSCFTTSALSPGLRSDCLVFLFLSAYTFTFSISHLTCYHFVPQLWHFCAHLFSKQKFSRAHTCGSMRGRPIHYQIFAHLLRLFLSFTLFTFTYSHPLQKRSVLSFNLFVRLRPQRSGLTVFYNTIL